MSERGQEIQIHLFGRTDVGQIREHNEDNFLVADLTRKSRSLMQADRHQVVGERGTVLGVCDGMGGAAAGEVASQMAVDIVYDKLAEGEPPPHHDELARRLVRAIEHAGHTIFSDARADRSRRGMGTTSTVAALLDSRLFVGQVGDSRAYILRNKTLVQVTRDQSLVNQLIEAGQLTEEEAETFEHNNIILQALGTAETVQVDLTYVDLKRGDRLMVCSDGLSGMMRADEMRDVMLTCTDPLEACKVLTDRANLAGGHDNITVIVADFDGAGLPAAGPDDTPLYQKYPLPESADATVRASPVSQPVESGPSDEASRESRKLKVGHTMVGVSSTEVQAAVAAAAAAPGPGDPEPGPTAPAAHYDPNDDPVDIPTSGLPPAAVGAMVLGALVVAACIGGYLALAN